MKRNKFLTLFAAVLMLLGVQSANAVTLQVVDGTNGGSIARLVDGNNGSKWEGGFNGGQYVILKNAANLPIIPGNYTIVTGNDNATWNGRGWKAWKIFGANFAYDAAASRDAADWVLLDEKSNITQDIVPDVNSTPFDFNFSEAITKGYVYFKIEVLELQGAGYMQMCEFILNNCTVDSSFADVLTSYDPSESDADLANAYAEGLAALSAATTTEETEAAMSTLAGLRQKMETINSGRFVALSWAAGNWGDGPGSNLVDKKESTKWGGNFDGTNPQYVIFRGKSMQPFFYKLVTGNDTATNTGRNWKTWKVFGGNFASEAEATQDAAGWVALDDRVDVTEEYLPMKNFYPATFDFNQGVSEAYSYYKVEVYAPHSGTQHQMSEMYLCTQEEFEAIRAPYVEEFAEFAAGLDALVVESDMEASKTTFAELYAELQTTSDAVRLTKIYNDLVALRDALLESSAFATGGYRCLSGNTAWGDGENWTKLVDGDTTTKWGGGMPSEGSFVIFKQYAAGQYNVYKLVTGNDTKSSPGRNWKKWKIYGANPKLVSGTPEAEQVTRDLSSWTLLDQKEDIGQDLLPGDNFTSAFFSFSEAWAKSYKYFKIEVEEAYSGSSIQMSEFRMLTDEEWEAERQAYIDDLMIRASVLATSLGDVVIPATLQNKILTESQALALAVTTATPEQLLPAYNAALQYMADAPALIADYALVPVEGVYQIATANQLITFADLVNGGEATANAVLTADIDMTGYDWTPIGNADLMYSGTFDGQGYKITNFSYTATGNNNGLFGAINNATVKDFGIYGTLTSDGFNYNGTIGQAEGTSIISGIYSALDINVANFKAHTGGIVGGMTTASTMEIHKCEYAGTLTHTGLGDCQAGIVGYTYGGGVFDCVFSGTIIGENNKYGGIMGYCKVPAFKGIQNCLSIGKIVADEACTTAAAILANWNGNATTSIKNNYYLLQEGSTTTIAIGNKATNCEAPVLVTAEQLASGEITFKLNNGEVEDVAWYQNLDKRSFKAEQYVVTADGTAEEPTAADVTLTNAADGTYTFTLPNFTLNILGMSLPVGDISLTGVEIADDGTFSQTGTYTVPAENIPAALAAYAAFFQSIPYTLTGKVNEEKLYAVVDLTVNVGSAHTVNVVAGVDDFEAVAPALAEGDAYPVLDATHGIVYPAGQLHCDNTPYAAFEAYSNDPAAFIQDSHDFVDGICSYCGIIDETYMTPNADGFFEIADGKQLQWFAAYVKQADAAANGLLVADIDLFDVIADESLKFSIGTDAVPFTGVFDGDGHTIFDITYTAKGQYNSLFGKIGGSAVVKNFRAIGTIKVSSEVTGRAVALISMAGGDDVRISNVYSDVHFNNELAGAQVGGILGGALNGHTTIDRCQYIGELDGNDAGGSGNYGGIAAYANNNAACFLTITNCLFDGKLVNSAETPGDCTFGGMVGYSNGAFVTIQNCLSVGTVQSTKAGQFFGAVKNAKSAIINSYYQGENVNSSSSTVTTTPEDATKVTDEQLQNGFVAAKLAPAFRQMIGSAYPTLNTDLPVVAEITSAGYATLYQEETDLEIPAGVEVFAGVKSGNWLLLNAIEDKFAASEPVVLRGEAGFYMFFPTTDATKAAANDLKGTAEGIEADGNMYILAQPEGEEIGFYRATPGTTITRGKAYLEDVSGVKAFIFDEDGATGIAEVETAVENGAIYNVAGQRLQKMQKGINIVGNKKVLK